MHPPLPSPPAPLTSLGMQQITRLSLCLLFSRPICAPPLPLYLPTYPGRYVNGLPMTWWLVDLGEAQLMANYYTLRQDGSSDYLRSWALQVRQGQVAGAVQVAGAREAVAGRGRL